MQQPVPSGSSGAGGIIAPTTEIPIDTSPTTTATTTHAQRRRKAYPFYSKLSYPHLPFRKGGLEWNLWIFLWMLLLDSLVILWFWSADAYFSFLTQWNLGFQAILATAAFAGRFSGEAQRFVNLILVQPVTTLAFLVMVGDLALAWNTDVLYLSKLSAQFGVSKGTVEFLNVFIHAWLPIIVFLYAQALGGRRLQRSRLGLCTSQKMACGFMGNVPVLFYCAIFNSATIYETNGVGNNLLILGSGAISAFLTGLVFWR